MSNFTSVNILDMINAIGEEELQLILSDFSCSKNHEIEEFVRKNAIEFAKRKMSITYLVVDGESRIVGIFTLTHKAVQLLDTGLTGTVRRKIQRHARLDEATDSYMLSAFLVAQFGKNYQYEESEVLTGNELMDMTIVTLKEIQRQIGGGVVYLECEDKPKLLSFYQNRENRYQIFGDRYSARDSVKYIQLMKII